MKRFKTALNFYSLILASIITTGAPGQILFYPVFLLLFFEAFGKFIKIQAFSKAPFPFLKNLSLYYGFIITSIMVLSGFIGARNPAQIFSAFLFLPIAFYFISRVLPKSRKAIIIPEMVTTPQSLKTEFSNTQPNVNRSLKKLKVDKNRRMFIKLIGSAGITLFVFSLFTKKAQAAFFGSVPGPGTVSIKDTTGTPIDPAIKQPTDGYKINQLDDSAPAYYGFVNKDGAWFIMKEDTGDYRYTKGASAFSTNWTGRAALTYDYFDAIF